MNLLNIILILISALSAIAAWIAVKYARDSRKRPLVLAYILDPDSPTFQNTGEENILLIEKIVRISNLSDIGTPVTIDIWTKSPMPLPVQVDTALKYEYSRREAVNGYFGKYLNMFVPVFMGRSTMLLHFWAKYNNYEHNDNTMFDKIEIKTNEGPIQIADRTNPDYYERYNKVIPHGSGISYEKDNTH